jgi:hypothetical protein
MAVTAKKVAINCSHRDPKSNKKCGQKSGRAASEQAAFLKAAPAGWTNEGKLYYCPKHSAKK